MSEVVLYSLPTCGRCKILKQKMNDKNIKFTEINDETTLLEKNINNVPIVEIDNQIYTFTEANSWINEQ